MTHTPLPWSVGDDNEVVGPDGENIIVTDAGFYPPTAEDAAHIVRCVNDHERVVAQRDALAEALRRARTEIHNPGAARSVDIDIIEMIDAALATVKSCVNAHDELRIALGDLLNCVDGQHDDEWLARTKNAARAALAKVSR